MTAKIVSTASLSFRTAGASATAIGSLLKFKAPGRKFAEIQATVFGDTARKRIPGKLDADGCTFSVQAPNAVSALAAVSGCLEICAVYTDGSKGYWGCLGSLSLERSEADVDGETVDSIDATMASDGIPSSIAVYGPSKIGTNNGATSSLVPLSGNYKAVVRLSAPASTLSAVAIGGQSISIPAGSSQATQQVSLSSSTASLLSAVFSGSAPANTQMSVVLLPA